MATFRLWAPLATDTVTVHLGPVTVPMERHNRGWWTAEVSDAGQGTRYAFSVDEGPARPDPRSRWQPDGVHAPSAVYEHSLFAWTDDAWRGVGLAGAVAYEVHVGTFTASGTFDAAIERLDHLVSLGVTLVELMPVAAFDGVHGWGYDGVALFAPHEPYGGPDGLKRLVDACHARGLGVCLDVVYNHLGPSGNYLAEFGPYFTDKHSTPWGSAVNLDDAGSDEVRRFVIDNALGWYRDFHVDALRVDAVHALHDERAVHILEVLSEEIDATAAALGRPLWLIAESDRNDPRTVTPREAGGYGVHGQWDDDVHHALHALVTGERDGYYCDFGSLACLAKVLSSAFFHDGTWSAYRDRTHGRPVDRERTAGWRFVASVQNHDQIGNRAAGDRLSVDELAIGAALILTSPYTPMLFMGEEWGAATPWQFFTDFPDPELAASVRTGRRREFEPYGWKPSEVPDPGDPATFERSKLDWSEPARAPHDALLRWYRDLIQLRRTEPDLADPRLDRVDVSYDEAAGWLVVARGRFRVVLNVAEDAQDVPLTGSVVLAWRPDDTKAGNGVVSVPGRSVAVVR
ncbi:malto-oligosyltrehalose trehalohydrolase [Tenggerimyces flavus]|uniref:Malto-oligosyltrehalose trehalohydrolase n=1 Tax=Tenggerimyces flavus TaxID=1708749 RepID=A0ABV7Y5Y9_9ACTN|nr:malto-oligosyltrehalose trehalohydrolase [Tenggerimyces flavus]MBM7788427.1 maltooligosyltrehalose trehalohydrolase [Tenggerimyces flavus]